MPSKKVQRKRRKFKTRGGLVREVSYLYEDEERALEEAARRKRCSKSEVIRRALRSYLRIERLRNKSVTLTAASSRGARIGSLAAVGCLG